MLNIYIYIYIYHGKINFFLFGFIKNNKQEDKI